MGDPTAWNVRYPDGKFIWIGNYDGSVSVYCAITYQLLWTISSTTPGEAWNAVFSPDNKLAYLVSGDSDPSYLKVIDRGTNKATGSITISDNPGGARSRLRPNISRYLRMALNCG